MLSLQTSKEMAQRHPLRTKEKTKSHEQELPRRRRGGHNCCMQNFGSTQKQRKNLNSIPQRANLNNTAKGRGSLTLWHLLNSFQVSTNLTSHHWLFNAFLHHWWIRTKGETRFEYSGGPTQKPAKKKPTTPINKNAKEKIEVVAIYFSP